MRLLEAKTLGIGALLFLPFYQAQAEQINEATYKSAAELQAAIPENVDGKFASSKIDVGGHAVVNTIRRVTTPDVEVHVKQDDFFIAHAGAAQIVVGGKVEGNHESAPNEWRGGNIVGGRTYNMAPGDVLWIPAGVPHQIIVPNGKSFSYIAFKLDAN